VKSGTQVVTRGMRRKSWANNDQGNEDQESRSDISQPVTYNSPTRLSDEEGNGASLSLYVKKQKQPSWQ